MLFLIKPDQFPITTPRCRTWSPGAYPSPFSLSPIVISSSGSSCLSAGSSNLRLFGSTPGIQSVIGIRSGYFPVIILALAELQTGQAAYALLKRSPSRKTMINHSIEGMFAVRQGEWKFIDGRGPGGWSYKEKIPIRQDNCIT